jgi:hypothetical protein
MNKKPLYGKIKLTEDILTQPTYLLSYLIKYIPLVIHIRTLLFLYIQAYFGNLIKSFKLDMNLEL